jgi:hypothetical protein
VAAVPQSSLSQLIADKVVRRVLPAGKPLKLGAGRGNGRSCDGCEKPITMMEIEHELDLPGGLILRFHVACAGFWQSAMGND